MWILFLLLALSSMAHAADVYDARSNRIGRTEERQGRIEVFDGAPIASAKGCGTQMAALSSGSRGGAGLDEQAHPAATVG